MSNTEVKNKSLGKALEILEALADLKKPIRLQDLAQKTDMSPSTLLRFLKTFIDYNYVSQDPETSMYQLTFKLASIGYKARNNFPLISILQKYISMITDKFGESSSICIERDMQVVYIATQDGHDHMLGTLSRIGKIAPMHSTGVGKLHLTQYPEEKLIEYVNTRGLPKLTEKTITTLEALKEELNKISGLGYAMDEEECEIGVRCVAVPVRNYSGRIIAALSISAPISRLSPEKTNEIIEYMKEIGTQASSEFNVK